MAMVWPCSTHKAIEHTHTTDKAKSSTYNPLRHKVAFRLLERLLRSSAVYTGGDKHENKLFVYCVTLFVNDRVFRGALVCT